MGRKNKRRITSGSTASPGLGNLAALQRAFGRSPDEIAKVLKDLGVSVVSPSGTESWLDDSLADEWAYQFKDYLAETHDLLEYAPDLQFEVRKIFANGEFAGICRQGRQTFSVFASVGQSNIDRRSRSKPVLSGCSCEVSQGEGACPHSDEFLMFLSSQLLNSDSSIRQMVEAKQFTKGQPDHSVYKPDPQTLAFRQLDAILSDPSLPTGDDPSEQDVYLPPRTESARNRLAWRVDLANSRLEVSPVLQQPKKRGGGYTKGRAVKLETLMADTRLALHPQDRRVLEHIEKVDSYYRYKDEYELDPFRALDELVGADHVYIDSTPVQITRYEIGFRVSVTSEDVQVKAFLCGQPESSKTQASQVSLILNRKDSVLWIGGEQGPLNIARMSPHAYQLVVSLLQLPPVAMEQATELLERLRKMSSWITIVFPTEEAGPVVTVDAPMAVLLRSGADGTLDVALRIRDAQGRLRPVGSSPSVTASQVDGKPVQLQRNVEAELQRADQLFDRLGLSPQTNEQDLEGEQFATRMHDFTESLDVIDRLQSIAPDSNTEVLWDKNSEKPISVLGSLSTNNVKVEINRKRDWFGISGECDFGNQQVPLGDLLENLSAADADSIHGDFIRLKDGQWAKISEKLRRRLRRLRDATHSDRKTLKLDATAAPEIRDLVGEGGFEIKAVKAWQDCLTRLSRAEALDPKLPEGLDATLRDYQIDGFKWLRRLAEWGVGGILADDMGLGKTLQTLAVILDRQAEGPALVIAPTSVGFNWIRETERFCPGLNPHLYRETDREDFLEKVEPGDVVVCSYGLALRDEKALSTVDWGTLVLDEAQAIKNSRSKTSRAIANIPAKWTVALTGTPVENHLGELWSLFHVVSPGVFGGWDQFRKKFAVPIEKNNDEDSRRSLAGRLQPFVLRRTKSQVLTELPPRTEMNLYVDLSDAERSEYEKVRLAAIGEVDQIESLPQIQDQRFRILALLTRLRQISCHAALVNKNYQGTAAKLVQLRETLSGLKEEGHRALIFSQFTEHLALIRAALDEDGFTYEYLDGSTPAKARQERVDAFQNGNADAFLISLKAGGTGLNLTAADYVIHMDPWWNPAVEDQATDRAHRMGQDKPVMVYRIVARNTIEEEILSLHETKRDLVAGVMDGTSAAAKLSNEDLIAMLRRGE